MSEIKPLRILKKELIANGFSIPDDIEIKFPLTVITGRNGSGKTRLLERIKENGIVYGPESKVPRIRQFKHDDLIPKIMGGPGRQEFRDAQLGAIQAYEIWKSQDFNLQIPDTPDAHDREKVIKAAFDIGKKLGKDPKELTHEEIEDHAPTVEGDPFAHFMIAGLFNRYVQDIQTNKKNEGYAHAGYPAVFFSKEAFIEHHGRPPWEILNEIVSEIFDGKFEFSIPDVDSRLFAYSPSLLEKGVKIEVDSISSGEKVILWLALILFKSESTRTQKPQEPSIFLFDEPDAFLHPQMVSTMYRAFAVISDRFNVGIIFTTHSPTTVALAPEGSLFNIANGRLDQIAVDEAISDLLDGVPQIAIDPAKRRQVFVESQFDAVIYQQIFTALKSKLTPSIFLNFVSAGAKIAEDSIKNVIRKHAKDIKEDTLTQMAEEINGHGDSAKVIAQVESLISSGSRTARGIIDWDGKNKTKALKYVSVLGEQSFYSIENWAIDPIGCVFLLNQLNPNKYPLSQENPDLKPSVWLGNADLLQASLDDFIFAVYKHPNTKTKEITYINGISLMSDPDHTSSHGHDSVETTVCAAFGELKGVAQGHRSKKLTCAIVDKFMVNRTEGELVPYVVLQCFAELQFGE
ncbi:AAA family ATPase [Variovorax paradoxus]|uniref:AAA family ATPase n=1 Tax=Variovorax paradoxus TaxID=34073 RepID=UPI003ECF4031